MNPPRIHVEVEDITPARAAELLQMNTRNRRINERSVRAFESIAYQEPDQQSKASATSALWDYLNGAYSFRGNFFRAPKADMVDLDALWRESADEIRAGVSYARRLRSHIGSTVTTPSVIAAAHVVFHRIDEEDAAGFFGRLITGTELEEGSPILALLRWGRNLNNGVGQKPESAVQMAYVIKAWNAYRDGRTVGLLRYKQGGNAPEQFPTPR